MRIMAFGAVCVLASLTLASGSRADPFCSDLKTITDGAGRGFGDIKGPPDDTFPDTFIGKVKPAGAEDCTIDALGAPDAPEYVCFWPHWPKKDEAWITKTYAEVVQQVDGCLSGAQKTTEPDQVIWRKPGAWTFRVTHRRIGGAIGKLRFIVGKG